MRYFACGVVIAALSTRVLAGETVMTEVVQGNNQFALDLHARLRQQPGNLFYSPASISIALGMTYAGARGETAQQMAKVLHFPGARDKLHEEFAALHRSLNPAPGSRAYRLSIANRLWGQAAYHFLPDFLALTRESYEAELAEVDFRRDPEGARQKINSWVAERTEGRIKDLIPEGVLDPLSRLVLTNAIYFKGDWSRPFAKSATHEEPFHVSSDKTTRVPLMHKQDEFRFRAGDGLKVLELPYGKGELSSYVLLPDQIDGLPAIEAKLSLQNLDRWIGELHRQKVIVYLPKFQVTSQFSMRDVLQAMGMTLAFDQERADFTGISTQEPLYISAVIHKAFVDVNEEGTEAAAATGVVVAARAAAILPQQPAVFRADHPFLFLIRDNKSGSILFVGRVQNPRA
jgi:serine protease inhibitor